MYVNDYKWKLNIEIKCCHLEIKYIFVLRRIKVWGKVVLLLFPCLLGAVIMGG
jgi:hypothetical protein